MGAAGLAIGICHFRILFPYSGGLCRSSEFLAKLCVRSIILIELQYTKTVAEALDHHKFVLIVVLLILDLHGECSMVRSERTPQHTDHFPIKLLFSSNRLSESIASSGNTLDQSAKNNSESAYHYQDVRSTPETNPGSATGRKSHRTTAIRIVRQVSRANAGKEAPFMTHNLEL